MRTLFPQFILFLCISLSVQGANRYWVASSQTTWNDAANWSNTSGGSGGASVPGSNDVAIFNGNGNGNCVIDVNAGVRGIDIQSDYPGTIVQNDRTITVGSSDFRISGGNFLGSNGNIHVDDIFQVDGGNFTCPSKKLIIQGDFVYTGGVFFHNYGTIQFTGSGNRYYDVTSPEPQLHNAVVSMNDNHSLSIKNKDLKVLNKIDLINGKINNGKVQIRDSMFISNDYDNGASDICINGSGNTRLIFSDGASMLKDVFIEKSSSGDTVFVSDQTGMGLINFGENNMDLIIRKGVLSFNKDFTTDLDFENLYLEAEGTLNISAGQIDFKGNYTNSGGTLDHSGGVFVFDDANNQTFSIQNSSQNKFYNLRVNKGDNKKLTIGSDDTLYVKNDLELVNGQVNTGSILVEGNVDIDEGFDRGSSKLTFSGSGEQTLALNGDTGNFDADMIIDKSTTSAVTLLSPFTMDGNNQDLILNKGIIRTDEVNILALDDNRTITGGSSESYIEGPLLKIGNDAFEFPVGRNSIYAPVSISRPSHKSHSFRAEYFDSNPDASYDNQSKDLTLDHISACEYWIVDRIIGDSEVEVTLSWEDQRSCGVEVLCDLAVARWDGTSWRDHGNGGTTGTIESGSIVTGSNCITPEVVVDFSPFTLASKTPNNPLPVELIDFTADLAGEIVEVRWVTATEINNDYFLIERSPDAVSWEELALIKGAGNSATPLNYSSIDNQPMNGINYYRLKQVDFDGTFEYSEIEAVQVRLESQTNLLVYPNPTTDYVRIRSAGLHVKDVSLFNMTGQFFDAAVYAVGEEIMVDLSHLPTGMYVVKALELTELVYRR